MSEVQRYYVGKYGLVEGESMGRLSVVLVADFDRATAERDAERRRADVAVADANAADAAGKKVSELLSNRTAERDALQALLTAADERAGALEVLVGEVLDADQRPEGCCCPPKGYTGLWAGAMCPIHFGLRAIKKAARPQGEPVAWIDWSGGDCPVDADAMVEYAMAGNPQQVCRPEVACRLDWRHDHRPTKRKSNIVKYRAVAEQPAPVALK